MEKLETQNLCLTISLTVSRLVYFYFLSDKKLKMML